MHSRLWAWPAAAVLPLLMLAGCKTPLFKPAIALTELQLQVQNKANGNAPFAVELVLVDNDELLQKMLALSAAQWFDEGAVLKRDYPKNLQSWRYELVPDQQLPIDTRPFVGKRGQALLLYANYIGRGAYRLRLDQLPKARVVFQESGIQLADTP